MFLPPGLRWCCRLCQGPGAGGWQGWCLEPLSAPSLLPAEGRETEAREAEGREAEGREITPRPRHVAPGLSTDSSQEGLVDVVGAAAVCTGEASTPSVLHPLEAADGLVRAHLPDGEAEKEPAPQPGGGGGHPAGHPEGRAAGRPGAAENWVRRGWSQLSGRTARALVQAQGTGRPARWVLVLHFTSGRGQEVTGSASIPRSVTQPAEASRSASVRRR